MSEQLNGCDPITTQSRRAREREQRTSDILDVALKHFVSKGYESASLDDMAAELELSKPALYRYFDSKEDLFNAARARGVAIMVTMVDEAVAAQPTGMGKIRAVGYAFCDFWRQHPDHYRMQAISRGIVRADRESKYFRQIMEYGHHLLTLSCEAIDQGKREGTIRPEIDTLMTAVFARDAVVAAIDASGEYMRVLESSGKTREEFVRHSVDLLLHSITK